MFDKKEYDKEWHKRDYKNNKEKRDKLSKQWQKDHPEHCRQNHFKSKYGLSHEDWLKMWDSQDGKCAICEKLFQTPSDARVDHNHETGEVRGLLCHRCNLGLSYIEDVEFNIKATEYLSDG